MFTLQELKSICSKKLEQYTKEKNEQKIKTFTLIQQMLEYEDALKKLGPEICFFLISFICFVGSLVV